MATIKCPGCNQEVKISIESVEVAYAQQLGNDEQYSKLRNIAQQIDISMETLLTEARAAAVSLEDALPLLENKYNICSVCGVERSNPL